MIRRFGSPPEGKIRYWWRPGAYALIWRAGRVLLTHQAWPGEEFQLPGGGIDPGEGPLRALHREVLEETGWTIGTPRFIGRYRRFCHMPGYDRDAEKLCSVWLAPAGQYLHPPTERGHSAHWLTVPQAISALGDPGARAMVRLGARWLPGGAG